MLVGECRADVMQPLWKCSQQYRFFPSDQAVRQLKKATLQSKALDVMMSIRAVGGAGEGRPITGAVDGIAT